MTFFDPIFPMHLSWWSKDEKKYLLDNLDKSDKEIAEALGRTETAVAAKRRRLEQKRRSNRRWKYEEDRWLVSELSNKELSEKLGRSMDSIKSRKRFLGL